MSEEWNYGLQLVIRTFHCDDVVLLALIGWYLPRKIQNPAITFIYERFYQPRSQALYPLPRINEERAWDRGWDAMWIHRVTSLEWIVSLHCETEPEWAFEKRDVALLLRQTATSCVIIPTSSSFWQGHVLSSYICYSGDKGDFTSPSSCD